MGSIVPPAHGDVADPTWAQEITAAVNQLLDSALAQYYRPTESFAKTSDTTLEAVPGMAFTVSNGGVYHARLLLSVSGADAGACKVDWDFSGGHDFRRWINGLTVTATNNMNANVTMPRRNGDGDQEFGLGTGSGSTASSYFEDLFIVAASDDTIQLRFAQATSNGTPSTVSSVSVLIVRRLA